MLTELVIMCFMPVTVNAVIVDHYDEKGHREIYDTDDPRAQGCELLNLIYTFPDILPENPNLPMDCYIHDISRNICRLGRFKIIHEIMKDFDINLPCNWTSACL